MNRAVVKQLKSLKGIKPRPEWNTSTRELLLSQINAQGTAAPSPRFFAGILYQARAVRSTMFHYTFGVVFDRPLYTGFAAAAASGLSVALFFAAAASLPGEPLYPVKETSEHISDQIQISFLTASDKPLIEVFRAEKRIEELRLISDRALSPEEKVKHVEMLAAAFSQKLSTAQGSLESVKSFGEAKKVAEIASRVTEKTGEYSKILKEVGARSGANAKLEGALYAIDDAHQAALEVIVEKKDLAGVPEEEIIRKLEEKFQAVQEELASLDIRMAAAGVSSQNGSSPTFFSAVEKSDMARRNLSQAKESLLRRDFKVVLEKLKSSHALVRETKDILAASATLRDADIKKRQEDSTNPEIQPAPQNSSDRVGF